MVTKFASDEHGLRERPPRTAEIDLSRIFIMDQTATVEDITELLVLRGRSSSDVAVSLAEDGTVFEPACRGTEDEICGSFDPAVSEILSLALSICIYGILVGYETAVDECYSVSVDCNRTCLTDFLAFSGSVLNRQIFCEEVRSIKKYSRCAEVPSSYPVGPIFLA